MDKNTKENGAAENQAMPIPEHVTAEPEVPPENHIVSRNDSAVGEIPGATPSGGGEQKSGLFKKAGGAVSWHFKWAFGGTVDGHKWGLSFINQMTQAFRHNSRMKYVWYGWLALVAYNVLVGILAAIDASTSTAAAAGADVTSLFKINKNTLPAQWLREILGPLPYLTDVSSGFSPKARVNTVIGAVMESLNAGALALGGFMVMYGFVSAVAQTAHEGEPLGRRWSSLWVPIRLPLGVGMLVPVSGGFSAAQLAVVWLCLTGSSMADNVWGKAVDKIFSADVKYIGSTRQDMRNIVTSILSDQLCFEAYKSQVDKDGKQQIKTELKEEDKALTQKTIEFGGDKFTRDVTETTFFFSADGVKNKCGSVMVPSGVKGNNGKGILKSTPSYDSGKILEIQDRLYKMNKDATKQLITDIGAVAQKIVAASKPNSESPADGEAIGVLIDNAVEKYQASYLDKVYDELNELYKDKFSDYTTKVKSFGWVYAGAYFNDLARTTHETISGSIITPTVQQGVSSSKNSSMAKTIDGIVSSAGTWIEQAPSLSNRVSTTGIATVPTAGGVNAQAPGKNPTPDSSYDSLTGKIFGPIGNFMKDFFVYNPNDPNVIGSMASLGYTIVKLTVLIIGGLTIAGLSPFVSGGPIVFSIVISPLITALYASGIVLAYVLPMIPYFLWVFGVANWFLLVLEAVVGATLWAMAHLSMDGEGIEGSKGGSGYMLVMNIVLRPTLMVVGLLLAMGALWPMARFVGGGVSTALFSVSQFNLAIIIGVVAYFIIYAIAMFYTCWLCFGLINQVPERVIRWIGGSPDIMGDQQARSAIGVISTQAPGAAGGISQGMMNSGNSIRDAKTRAEQWNNQQNGRGGGNAIGGSTPSAQPPAAESRAKDGDRK